MSVLWAADRPLTRSEIIDLAPLKTWKPSSIHILLNSMLEKKAIVVAGFAKAGKHYGRTYAPAYTEAQHAAMQIQTMESYQDSKSTAVKGVISALLDDSDLSDETLKELESLLSEKRKKK